MGSALGKIHDVREELARGRHAIANLTVLAAGSRVGPHVHVNSYLALHVLGSYRDSSNAGEFSIEGPAALLFPAGSTHEMAVGSAGLATVIIEFDSDALNRAVSAAARLEHPRYWVGGRIGHHASRLAQAWLSGATAQRRFEQTIAFLNAALAAGPRAAAPSWLRELEARIDEEYRAPDVGLWARQIGVSRPRLARTYRYWRGEGLGQAIRRHRVEESAILLESTDLPLAEIAAQAGFYDQSHMNRAFRKCLGRTPAAAKAARFGLTRA
jgi:AraC family transcriptional regulator